MNKQKRNYNGYMIQFPIGLHNDMMSFVLMSDDGTWGDHLIIKFNDIPCGTIPVINGDGIKKMIEMLERVYKDNYKTK